jgi:toxin-antitoxin system PIN domain toxin
VALIVDTNILLYAANRACPEHQLCLDFLRAIVSSGDICFVPENIIYEFLRVATHPRVFPQPLRASEAVHFLDALLSPSSFRVLGATERHWVGLRALVTEVGELSGNFFFDVHTVALMREHGIRRIASADSDFAKFSGLEIINPIRQERIRWENGV